MSSKGGYTAAPPRQGGDRFYNPPMVRRHQQVLQQQLMQRQLLQQQQQQLQQHHQQQQQLQKRAAAKAGPSSAAEAEKQSDAGESSVAVALPLRHSVGPSSTVGITNLDRLMESVTPYVQARYSTEVGPIIGTSEVESRTFFYLEDLWEAFSEWSVYGAGVPLLLRGRDPVEQYYVPFLSGIQLYADPSSRLRLTSSAGSSDSVGGRNANSVQDFTLQRLSRLHMGDKSPLSSAEMEYVPAPGLLFHYMEQEQPYYRRPLVDKALLLTSEHPELGKFRSCDLLPTSWISVAWYPIYRIPVGPTLQDLDTSFLTFHSLSTQSSGSCPPPQLHAAHTRMVRGFADPTARISLPVFALAAYKLKGSMLSPCGAHECEQENLLLQAADKWLKHLNVSLPDYQFFCNQHLYRR